MRGNPLNARIKQWVWVLAAVAGLSAATLAIFYGIAEAQGFATASATAPVEGAQSANRNADATVPTGPPDGATQVQANPMPKPSQPALEPTTRLVVNPGDSLWSISQERLHPSATAEQVMNEVERTFELNRDRIGDDPNLILPGQEILLPPVSEPAAAEPAVAERVPEPINEPVALPDFSEGEAVPAAAGIAESSAESYADERRLLGLGIIVLTFALGILGVWRLPMKREVGSPTGWRTPPEGYSENYALRGGPDELRHISGPASGSLVATQSSNNLGDKDLTNRRGSDPTRTIDTKAAPRSFRAAPYSPKAFKTDVRRGGGVPAASASAMLLPMAEGEDYYTPPQAARILRLSRQRITQMLQSGEMEGKQDPKSGRWKIPQRVVHARLKDRPARDRSDGGGPRNEPEGSQRLGELELEVRDLSYRLGRSEARLELTEKTESTVRAERDRLLENLERERRRADSLEAELRDTRRPWWRKLFGG